MANKNVNDFQYPLFNDVLEGMEKKNDSGGGGGVTVVTFENSLDSPDEYTPNMTGQEMVDAAPNGIICVRLHHSAREDAYFQMYPGPEWSFYHVYGISGGIRVERLIRTLGSTKWHFSYVDYSLTPST